MNAVLVDEILNLRQGIKSGWDQQRVLLVQGLRDVSLVGGYPQSSVSLSQYEQRGGIEYAGDDKQWLSTYSSLKFPTQASIWPCY